MISVSVVRSGFRPLTGMVPSNIEEVYYYDYSRPLAGIVPQCLPSLARSSSSRPLTGIVLYDYQIKGFFKDSFSPPYGDGTIQAKPNVPHC